MSRRKTHKIGGAFSSHHRETGTKSFQSRIRVTKGLLPSPYTIPLMPQPAVTILCSASLSTLLLDRFAGAKRRFLNREKKRPPFDLSFRQNPWSEAQASFIEFNRTSLSSPRKRAAAKENLSELDHIRSAEDHLS